MSELNKRLISAALLITIFSFLIYDASYIGIAAADLVFVIILWEFLFLIEHKKNRIIFVCVFAFLCEWVSASVCVCECECESESERARERVSERA